MKILNLSAYDVGGAGAAAFCFHKNLLERGIDSKMLVLSKRAKDENVIAVAKTGPISRMVLLASRAKLKLRSSPDYYFQDQTVSAFEDNDEYLEGIGFLPDLIVAHWISNFASVEDLHTLSTRYSVPVIWYMLDMAPLTGGCHYAWDCRGYTKQCGRCPALHSARPDDLSSAIWEKKHNFIQKTNMTIVSGSWLINHAKKASLFAGKRKEPIMLGVDSGVFRPRARAEARKELGVPGGKKVVFAGSQSMKQRRKGMTFFLQAMSILEENEGLDTTNIVVLTAGDVTAKKALKKTSFENIHLGMLNERGLVKAYQSADVFVCPSIEEAGPMMTKESIMCGTPVVSFDMGAAVDLVRTGHTGYRATLMDSGDLAKGIMQILSLQASDARKMSRKCREIGLELSDAYAQVGAFIALAKEIVGQNARPS